MIPSVDLIEPRKRRMARWIGAATLVGALHIGGGSYAMLYWQEALLEEAAGAIVVEIAPIASSLAIETIDLPPGPLAEEAASTQAASDPRIEKAEQDTPVEELRSPTDPEVALQKPTQVEEKPKEEPKEEPSPQVKTTQEQMGAPKTTAPMRFNAETSTKTAAAEIGTSAESKRSIVSWQNSLVLHLNRHKQYPATARSQGVQGEVRVRFSMDRSGQVSIAEIVRSSGSVVLDAEALALLKRASPLPRPPPAVVGEVLERIVPITFKIN